MTDSEIKDLLIGKFIVEIHPDFVVIFEEDTPLKLIKTIKPDVLFKGADYKLDEIVGAEYVESIGGKTIRIKLTKNQSTTRLIKMLNGNN